MIHGIKIDKLDVLVANIMHRILSGRLETVPKL